MAMLSHEAPVTQLGREELSRGVELVELLTRTKLAESKGAARKAIEGGGVYLNNERQTNARKTVSSDDLKWPNALLLRTGKKNYHLVLVE